MKVITGPAALLVGGRAIGLAVTFAIGIVFARVFDPATVGIYKQFFLVYATLYGLAQLGMAESLYYFVPRKVAHTGRYVCNAMLTLGAAGAICAAALYIGRFAIASHFNSPELADYMLPLGLFLTFTLTSTVFEIVMVSRKHHVTAAITYGLSDVARTALFVAPALLFASLRAVFIGATIFAALRLAAAIAALFREFGREFRIDLSVWREQLAYALPFALAVGIEVIQINYHQYVVASTFDPATFAIYAFGCLQIPLVDLIVTSTVNVLMVQMAEDATQGRLALALWHDTIVRLAFLLFPLAAFLLIAAHDLIVGLFTTAYIASVPIFMVWALAVLPNVLAVDAVLRVYAQTRFLLVMNLMRLGAVAAFIGWFLGAFGLVGAVLVTVIATVFVKLIGVVRITRLMHVPLAEALPWTRLAGLALLAVAATAPAIWVRQELSLPPLVSFGVIAAVYGGAYFLMAYAGHVYQARVNAKPKESSPCAA